MNQKTAHRSGFSTVSAHQESRATLAGIFLAHCVRIEKSFDSCMRAKQFARLVRLLRNPPTRNRTWDLLLKRELLYRLSYGRVKKDATSVIVFYITRLKNFKLIIAVSQTRRARRLRTKEKAPYQKEARREFYFASVLFGTAKEAQGELSPLV